MQKNDARHDPAAHTAAAEDDRRAVERRVRFDFEIEFSNGGGLQGQDFRLDITGDDISDEALADYVVRDLRLLMVGAVRIRNKQVFAEPHKRLATAMPSGGVAAARRRPMLVDVSHVVEDGMVTYKGLPAPAICDFMSREGSRAHYGNQAEFQIGRIDMVANTGTYVDSPFHRYPDGRDLSELDLASLAELDAVVVRATGMAERGVSHRTLMAALADIDLRGRAVLVHTGWDRHWRTDQYFEGHPFLTADAARYLVDQGVALVGIDSLNIDDTGDLSRPVHTTLLGAGVPIAEHLRALHQLPLAGFRFSAVPVKVRGMGTFPVRAYAVLDDGSDRRPPA